MNHKKIKINVGILFGGKSVEHEISIKSAENVISALDKEKYNPILIGIDKNGKWFFDSRSQSLLDSKSYGSRREDSKSIELKKLKDELALVPQSQGKITNFSKTKLKKNIDVVFPILHGPFGEDGTVQGLLKLANIPFVGASVLGSAVGMDKDVMKRLLKEAKIPIGDFIVLKEGESFDSKFIIKKLGLPVFVKPANLGSSVGISKVKKEKDLKKATLEAFKYDRKIIIEEYIEGREIECAVLGNDNPKASVPGEIIPQKEFYSYEAKYIDENGARLGIPAKISKEARKKVQDLAVKTFKVLCCEGLGRVDCFLKKNGDVLVNEINTIPGFTSISMYPRLWQESGIGYRELIDKLIQLAIERFKKEQKLKTTY